MNPLLLSDTYKQTHSRMYPKGLKKLVSYLVPRKSMFKNINKMVFYYMQAIIKEYLISNFKKNFFEKSEEEIIESYTMYMDVQLGEGNYELQNVITLHRLGYLPLWIRALPEGTRVNMGVPCVEIANTHEDFAWLVQWIECLLQTELWRPCLHATVGDMYYQVAKEYYDKTVDDIEPEMAMSEFGMRGAPCLEASAKTATAWLLSFNKTSTIPSLVYLKEMYSVDFSKSKIGIGAVSTEHSVMGANFAVDGDEITFVKKLLTKLYPNNSFSMVADTYDYWNMVDNILPACKKEIIEHNGKLLIRPDSGDIIDISIRTVQKLRRTFGGTVNSKGYKVLDQHIGLILGDGCVLQSVTEIYRRLEELGFAASCIVFGVGAFCFSATFEESFEDTLDGTSKSTKMIVHTRDSFGVAMKASYGVIDEQEVFIYKDPKTDTDGLKKSHKGCCQVYEEDGDLKCKDHLYGMIDESETLLKTVFKDGKLYNETTFMEIRERLHN